MPAPAQRDIRILADPAAITRRAADELAEARKSSEYPASIAQYRRQADWLTNPDVAAWADATYFKGCAWPACPKSDGSFAETARAV